jgi:hypothetical protein
VRLRLLHFRLLHLRLGGSGRHGGGGRWDGGAGGRCDGGRGRGSGGRGRDRGGTGRRGRRRRRGGNESRRRGHRGGMRGCNWGRRCCRCRLGLDGRCLQLHGFRRPGRFRKRLRPGGRFPRHRHRGLGIRIDRHRVDGGRGRFRHRLRPVRRRLLHRLRGRRPLAVTLGSHIVFPGLRSGLCPCRQRLLHRQRRLGLVGVGGFRLCRFGGLCCLRWLCCLGGLGRLSGIRRFLVGYGRLRCRADRVLRGRGSHRWDGRRHLGFGQIGQQRFNVAGNVRRVNSVRRERFFLVHGAQSSQSIFGAPGWRSAEPPPAWVSLRRTGS